MTTNTLESDINYLDSILNNKNNNKFNFIYSRTNEDLARLFNEIDLKNKDVYTVLSSSDFLFSALVSGAKSVDTFDINSLTYRYYHLRKWLLEYDRTDASGLSLKKILNIINQIKPNSPNEKDSIIFWRYYLTETTSHYFYSKPLFSDIKTYEHPPYEYRQEYLLKRLNEKELNFNNTNICTANLSGFTKTYDTCLISNILDYNRVPTKLQFACNNLYNLLKPNGTLICSNMSVDNLFKLEQSIFSSCFDYKELFTYKQYGEEIKYYKYTKKLVK